MMKDNAHSAFYDFLGKSWVRWLLGGLILVSFCFLVVVVSQMGEPGAFPEAPDDDSSFDYPTIVDLELAFTPAKAMEVLETWGGEGRDAFLRNLKLDSRLIAAYVVFGMGLMLLLAAHREGAARGYFATLAALPLLAGVCDLVENHFLRQIATAFPAIPSENATAIAGIAAATKFVFLLVPILAALVLGVVWWRHWRRRGHLDLRGPDLVELKDVLEEESRYLKQRRKLAGLEPGKDVRPVGLAFSGGGIRSATVNLGALQALAARGVLSSFDYLSTVSGGGYIGAAFSSLLSLSRSGSAVKPETGSRERYAFDSKDEAVFTADGDRFPFNPNVPHGRTQMEHIRTHGDFLIQRRRIIHRDVLRAVGSVLGGIAYHWVLYFLVLLTLASLFVASVQWLAGDFGLYGASLDASVGAAFGRYLEGLWMWPGSSVRPHPFLGSMFAGALIVGLTILVASQLIWKLPEGWFQRRGETMEETRDYHALWSLFWTTALATVGLLCAFRGTLSEAHPGLLLVPLGVTIGGLSVALLLHPIVAIVPRFRRNERSLYSGWEGIFYLMLISSTLLAALPFALSFQYPPGSAWWSGAGWLISLFGIRSMMSKGSSDESPGPTREWLDRFKALPLAAKKFVLGLAVAVFLLLSFVFLATLVQGLRETLWKAGDSPALQALFIALVAAAAVWILGRALDYNKLSLHYFYRDRLVEAYLQTYSRVEPSDNGVVGSLRSTRDDAEMPLTHLHGVPKDELEPEAPGLAGLKDSMQRAIGMRGAEASASEGDPPKRSCVTASPLHLFVTSLNLTSSRDLTRRDRKSDYFIFSKLFCGSRTSGFTPTQRFRSGATKVARAMTLSGAAASTAMGHRTFFAQAFALTLFNVRLGQWIENPGYKGGEAAWRQENGVFWPKYLLRELLGSTDANHRLVHLSDGAHTGDNLGIYPLLQRRCKVILSIDAESDAKLTFGSLAEALRQAYIDHLITGFDLRLGDVRLGPDATESARHFAIGKVHYPGSKDSDNSWLLVVKTSITERVPETLKSYRLANPSFPHQTTGDQFFDDSQLESYRALGEHMLAEVLEIPKDSEAKERPKESWESICERIWNETRPAPESS